MTSRSPKGPWRLAVVVGLIVAIGAGAGLAAKAQDAPVLSRHVEQADIDSGGLLFSQLFQAGRFLFNARFNKADGQGRPASMGHGAPRTASQPAFTRMSGPDANSCEGCHFQPRSGGAGDFATNVFVLAQERDPVVTSFDPRDGTERNSLGMNGSGAIELLAREMTRDLVAIRETALAEATKTAREVRRPLVTKGISFGTLLALPDGRVDPREIVGVDWDLVIKPFHQKGAVVSLREFTVTAMNQHHGMQAVERFGAGLDADNDGVVDELTEGDITALTIYQAGLNLPGRKLPFEPERRAEAVRGERIFADVGCVSCHVAELPLNDPVFAEPGPFNPPGNLRAQDKDARSLFKVDLSKDIQTPRVSKNGGRYAVRAFTDLKRHDLNDGTYAHFANERAPQGFLHGVAPTAAFTEPTRPRPLREFLTRKLWDAGSSAPYGHRGDLTTLTEAIHFHGGEARAIRDRYFALPEPDRAAVVEFLKSLQVLPEGSPAIVTEDRDENPLRALGKAKD
ncbi:MAG: di-heme oxidoredictase family protein [Anaerolineaceae bacterium]